MSDNALARGLTRRQFLKATAATAAIATVGDGLVGSRSPMLVPGGVSAAAEPETKYGFCRMCHRSFCPTVYKVVNGVATNVTGDTRGVWSGGRLCVRGNASLMHLYNPYRAKAPMKRTNPKKGLDQDPGWVEISWDEALNTVATRLATIRKEDPRKFVFIGGFGGDYNLLQGSFTQAYGTPNALSVTGAMCSVHLTALINFAYQTFRVDPGYCNYCIAVGDSLGPNLGHGETSTWDVTEGIERGMKVVAVDPRLSPEASKGEWVPIRPGTELAMMLAMTNVIINELQTYDVWFLKNRSNSVYLIGPDGNYVRDAASKKPMIWDPTDSKAKTFDDTTIKDYALEGNFTAAGVQAQPSFALMKAQVKQYTPEWQEQITSISAATVRRITKEFVEAAQIGSTITIDGVNMPYRPVCLTVRRGMTNHYLGHVAYWMAGVINILVGSVNVPGGAQSGGAGPILKPDADGTVTMASMETPEPFKIPMETLDAGGFYPFGFSQGFRLINTILDPKKYYVDYKPEAFMTFGTNFFSKAAADADKISQALASIPFTVSISYHMDEHSAFADIILPENAIQERYLTRGITERRTWSLAKTNYTGGVVGQPIVDPIYNARQADAIFLDLADRMGFLLGKGGMNDIMNRSLRLSADFQLALDRKYTIDQVMDQNLKSSYGADKGLAYFKGVGFIAKPMKPADVFDYTYFPGNKTRHQVYAMTFKKAGDDLVANLKKAGVTHPAWTEEQIRAYHAALPQWKPGATMNPPAGFDLYAMLWKSPSFLFDISNSIGNPYLQEVSKTDPNYGKIVLNSATAAKKGFKEGDMVFVEGQFGGKIGPYPVHVTEGIHPDVMGVLGGGARQAPGMNPIMNYGVAYNKLLSTREDTLDVLTAAIDLSPRVKVTKA
jgi:anaerobic selenocysteine-containing dehydrogenase